jgi:hypothetical protein
LALHAFERFAHRRRQSRVRGVACHTSRVKGQGITEIDPEEER